jgi:hypothetical protein
MSRLSLWLAPPVRVGIPTVNLFYEKTRHLFRPSGRPGPSSFRRSHGREELGETGSRGRGHADDDDDGDEPVVEVILRWERRETEASVSAEIAT